MLQCFVIHQHKSAVFDIELQVKTKNKSFKKQVKIFCYFLLDFEDKTSLNEKT